MEVLVFDTIEEASAQALTIFKDAVDKGAKVFGLATGSTPEKLYELMVQSDIDFTESTSINLDEYYGLSGDHPQSYHYFMKQRLFDKKPFKTNYLPDGLNENTEEETARYNQILAENPIDLQLLGIGNNGHIGFNEPGADLDGKTQLADLAPSTIEANKRFFDSVEEVPTRAYSMGIASILNSKKILLLAFGESKAEAVKNMIEGPVTSEVPASALQKHENVIVILDKDAASLLSK
ncbi:glucosamine-6-phosphate deaminase [Jeotgalibaca ciconiae]|uniref:Glucosamine-6-phosphate deaminase n=1 Tax=Jeotgalibaca ciconiae TaxID=2496265 RepID=A0A3S9HAN6_9LACT|nr:glucosamine-6-phosphate deaminase [Jeotgalibaca ciconiae]AZP04404.1 glucosamine-6-phosphate deaminase [Jeotgalibaca ciconiae]HJB24264.1 glucosamine-6-phosphate deaminase [Candidatus Jeotgalibaca pullicola]